MPTADYEQARPLYVEARRQGYLLQRSPRRRPPANDYGLYRIVDAARNVVVAGGTPWDYSLTLDDVRDWLSVGGCEAGR